MLEPAYTTRSTPDRDTIPTLGRFTTGNDYYLDIPGYHERRGGAEDHR